MNKTHAAIVALVLGIAAVFGVFAASRTAGIGVAARSPGVDSDGRCARRTGSTASRQRSGRRCTTGRRRCPPSRPRLTRPSRRRRSSIDARRRSWSFATPDTTTTKAATTVRTEEVKAAMTSHVSRLYALALALVLFFLTWTVVAARPWATTSADPRLAALAAREQRVRRESIAVQRIVRHRWAVYRVRLHQRQAQIATAKAQIAAAAPPPSVRVVTLPPLTVTRTS